MRPALIVSVLAFAAAAALVLVGAFAVAASSSSQTALAPAPCSAARWTSTTQTRGGIVKTTIAQLRSLPVRRGDGSARAPGAESTWYEIRATLVGAQLDADGDIRLVLMGASRAETMIAELPAPACRSGLRSSKVKAQLAQARTAFLSACGTPSRSTVTPLTGRATVRGVGFFEPLPGQAGVAANGLQLNPVSAFRGATCTREGAALPNPPAPYTLPDDAVVVASSKELRSALATHTGRDIVLRDGTYDNPEPFANSGGNRLWARNLGGAVLRAGIELSGRRGSGGGMIRGLVFDVDDPAKTLQDSIIHVWGAARAAQILDVRLRGNMKIGAGIHARQVEGLVVRRVVAERFRSYGVRVDMNILGASVSVPAVVEDVRAAYVTWPTPRASNGTAEACVWIGNTATVRRIETHDCAWEGLWAGTASTSSVFEDVISYDNEIGVYLEHYNSNSTFRRVWVGPGVRIGVMCEWADPAWNHRPGCTSILIEQSYFDTRLAGVVLDEGTTETTVRTSTFVNQCWAGIGNYRGVGNLWDTTGNDFGRMKPGAAAVTTQHYFTGKCA